MSESTSLRIRSYIKVITDSSSKICWRKGKRKVGLYLEIELFRAFVYYRNISTEYLQQGSNILNVIEFLFMSAAICTLMESYISFPLIWLGNVIHTFPYKSQEVSFEWHYRKWVKATGRLWFWNSLLFVPGEDS
jgi:hypothetical protein